MKQKTVKLSGFFYSDFAYPLATSISQLDKCHFVGPIVTCRMYQTFDEYSCEKRRQDLNLKIQKFIRMTTDFFENHCSHTFSRSYRNVVNQIIRSFWPSLLRLKIIPNICSYYPLSPFPLKWCHFWITLKAQCKLWCTMQQKVFNEFEKVSFPVV